MSEPKRITEAELQTEAGILANYRDEEFARIRPAMAERLVAEVRRLRALIVAGAGRNGDGYCNDCRTSETGQHAADCPAGALEAEGDAVRLELEVDDVLRRPPL